MVRWRQSVGMVRTLFVACPRRRVWRVSSAGLGLAVVLVAVRGAVTAGAATGVGLVGAVVGAGAMVEGVGVVRAPVGAVVVVGVVASGAGVVVTVGVVADAWREMWAAVAAVAWAMVVVVVVGLVAVVQVSCLWTVRLRASCHTAFGPASRSVPVATEGGGLCMATCMAGRTCCRCRCSPSRRLVPPSFATAVGGVLWPCMLPVAVRGCTRRVRMCRFRIGWGPAILGVLS